MSEFYDISREIASELGALLTVRPYCAIVNANGEICYIDSELEEYSDLIKDFLATTYPMLKVGDHSVPLSGINMIFFKISEKAMVILHTKKGALGQLLAFKPIMHKYIPRIDSNIGDIKKPIEEEIEKAPVKEQVKVEVQKRKSKFVPLLVKDLGDTKIPIEHATILNLCNGENDVEYIMKESNKTRLYINQIIRQYQKQGFIKLKKAV